MDDLLRYALFRAAIALLLIELGFIALCLLIVIVMKSYYVLTKKWNVFVQGELSQIIRSALEQEKSSVLIPKKLRSPSNLLFVLTEFNRKISDALWEKLKTHIVETTLLKKARGFAVSRFWTKRLRGAQCFTLTPSLATYEELLNLLHDPILLVRIVAAEAILKKEDKALFIKLIEQISKESKLAKLTYRDLLIQADSKQYEWLEEILSNETNPAICAVCLDIFTAKTTKNLFPRLIRFLYGTDLECRLLAVKILKNIPSERTNDILVHCLKDSHWEVRAEALKSLPLSQVKRLLPDVESLLQDPVWFVRLQAALVIKNLGTEGLSILGRQSPGKSPDAYEISQYALRLVES